MKSFVAILLILCAPLLCLAQTSAETAQPITNRPAKTSPQVNTKAIPTKSSNSKVETATPDDSDFVGLVQFVEGRAIWLKRPKRNRKEKIKFKSFIHQADAIAIAKNSFVKIISFQRCTGVIYGRAKFFAPLEIDRQVWGINAKGLRWICPKDQNQKLNLNGYELHLEGAEVLFTNDTLLVKKGTVSTPEAQLDNNKLYKLDDGQWLPQKQDKMANWKFDQSLKAPKESIKLTKPEKKIKPDTSRWILAHSFGLFSKMNHKEDRLNLDRENLKTEGEQLMFQYKKGKKGALLGRISFVEARDRKDEDTSFCFDPNTGNNICPDYNPNQHNQVEWISAELGWRTHFNKNWSLYYLGGITQTEHRINSFYSDLNIGVNQREVYWGLTGAIGLDYLVMFSGWWDWLGFYMSAELRLMTTVSHSETKQDECYDPNGCQNQQDLINTDENFSLNGGYISLGPFIRF